MSVVGVEYDKASKILFTASGAFIRAWDLRESNIRPMKTLCSSGVALSGLANLSSIPTGEAPITALKMGTSGNLYTAASDKVRFWDLRMFSCIGKLSGGHQAAVMCVTAWDGPNNTDYVATGSKDHYVKVTRADSFLNLNNLHQIFLLFRFSKSPPQVEMSFPCSTWNRLTTMACKLLSSLKDL